MQRIKNPEGTQGGHLSVEVCFHLSYLATATKGISYFVRKCEKQITR